MQRYTGQSKSLYAPDDYLYAPDDYNTETDAQRLFDHPV
jgi:hypothetical protein